MVFLEGKPCLILVSRAFFPWNLRLGKTITIRSLFPDFALLYGGEVELRNGSPNILATSYLRRAAIAVKI
jgi:hypothetical protein